MQELNQQENCDVYSLQPTSDLEPLISKSMFLVADDLLTLRDNLDLLEIEVKRIKQKIEENEARLFDMMINSDVDQFKRSGYTFSPTIKKRVSIRSDVKDIAMEWLKESDYSDLVKETVNAQTLTSLVREWEETGVRDQDQAFMAMLNIFNDQKISIRKGR